MIHVQQEFEMNKTLIAFLLLCPLNTLAGQANDGFLRKMVQDAANAQIPAGAVAIKLVKLRASGSLLNDRQVGVHFKRGEDFSGSTLVELEIGNRSRWVQAEFRLMVKTAVAEVNLQKGHVLGAGDIRIATVAKKSLRGDEPTEPKDILGMIVTQNIRAGQALVMRRLKRPIVVHRGDEVQIVVSSGGVRVTSPGKALAAGRTGDIINVSRGSGRKRGCKLRAKVVASGLVLMELGNTSFSRQ